MHHEVPFISQQSLDDVWKKRGCGITALKIVFDYWHERDSGNSSDDIHALLQKGIENGAYIDEVGWSHKGLLSLAKQYGYTAYNRDRATNSSTALPFKLAMNELSADLEKGPVIASVWKNLNPLEKGGHLVVLSEMSDSQVTIIDPEKQNQTDGVRVLPLQQFINGWKLRTICILPQKSVL